MQEIYSRAWTLDNIEIVSRAKGGDGRTVEAYAAVFGVPVEVKDQHGHYNEIIDRSAFNRTLNNNGTRSVTVLYNHGMTAFGTPDMLGSVPLGTPLDIRADNRGLLTVTRYNKSELADAVLAAIENGDLRSQSFRGRIYKSNPMRVPRARPGQPLPTVTRMEMGLSDYGPTPIPVYEQAAIMAVRSAQELATDIANLDQEAIAELVRTLSTTSDARNSETEPATPETGLGAGDSPDRHSDRQRLFRLKSELRFRGV